MRLLLLALLLFVLGARLVRSMRPRTRPAAPAPPPRAGRMVRDRVCNTFLPIESALPTALGGETHYFCSEACRSRFLRSARGAATA